MAFRRSSTHPSLPRIEKQRRGQPKVSTSLRVRWTRRFGASTYEAKPRCFLRPALPLPVVFESRNPKPFPWAVVLLLSGACAVAFVDRALVAVAGAPIKHDLGLSDTQYGLLQGIAFVILFAVARVPLGVLADRLYRRAMTAIGLAFWSAMTAVCGLAGSFGLFFWARVGVGVGLGEACLLPARPGRSSRSWRGRTRPLDGSASARPRSRRSRFPRPRSASGSNASSKKVSRTSRSPIDSTSARSPSAIPMDRGSRWWSNATCWARQARTRRRSRGYGVPWLTRRNATGRAR